MVGLVLLPHPHCVLRFAVKASLTGRLSGFFQCHVAWRPNFKRSGLTYVLKWQSITEKWPQQQQQQHRRVPWSYLPSSRGCRWKGHFCPISPTNWALKGGNLETKDMYVSVLVENNMIQGNIRTAVISFHGSRRSSQEVEPQVHQQFPAPKRIYFVEHCFHCFRWRISPLQ